MRYFASLTDNINRVCDIIDSMSIENTIPLGIAINYNRVETVELLLIAGANPFIKDSNGWKCQDLVHDSKNMRKVFKRYCKL
jgi:ankyrin repeat protein